jgi:hypothetical protein
MLVNVYLASTELKCLALKREANTVGQTMSGYQGEGL